MTVTVEDLQRYHAKVTAEVDAITSRQTDLTAQIDAAKEAQRAALDAGEIEAARTHAAAVKELELVIAEVTAEADVLRASQVRLGEQIARAASEQELQRARDVAAASTLALRQDVDRLAEMAVEISALVRKVEAGQERTHLDAVDVHAREAALGLREMRAHPDFPRFGGDFFDANPEVSLLGSLQVRR